MRLIVEKPCEHGRWHACQVHTKGWWCPGGTRTELGMAALTKAIDDAAAEAGVAWNPNMGMVLKRAVDLVEQP